MEFEWNETKRAANIAKHGIDFVSAAEVFDGRPAIAQRTDVVIESRWKTTATVSGRFITVIWTKREDRVRIISARRAWDAEKRKYREIYERGN